MKQLIRKLSQVSDSSSPSPRYTLLRQQKSTLAAKLRRLRLTRIPGSSSDVHQVVPHGHVPVYVGDEMEKFILSAELLNHPIFIDLLEKSAQEYGYEQQGALRIPCHVLEFERILEAIRLNLTLNLQDLIDFSLSEELY